MNTQKEETIAQEALRLLSPIPAKNWFIGKYTNEKNKCCAVGHYSRAKVGTNSYKQNDIIPSDGSNYYSKLLNYTLRYSAEKYNLPIINVFSIAQINDNYHGLPTDVSVKYNQKTPKGRVLAFLTDMVNEGW